MHFVLVDPPEDRLRLLPFACFLPIALLRVGVSTFAEKWRDKVESLSLLPAPYLRPLFPPRFAEMSIFVRSGTVPTKEFLACLEDLPPRTALYNARGAWLACKLQGDFSSDLTFEALKAQCPGHRSYTKPLHLVENLCGILRYNERALASELAEWMAKKSTFHPEKNHSTEHASHQRMGNRYYGKHPIHFGKGASIYASTFSTLDGPIYVGERAWIEDAFICGPCMVGEAARVSGARVEGSVLGTGTKIGGEVIRSVVLDHSNKAHHGFLGDSVIGRWCNIGAGTSVSNLKNTYSSVSLWDYTTEDYRSTHRQFCGLFMGDYSKCGINTMFNTGSVVGVSTHVFGSGFLPKHVPSFCWNGHSPQEFALSKAIEVAERTLQRRKKILSGPEKDLFRFIFEETASHRE